MINKVSKPKVAQVPNAASFPEGERVLAGAPRQWEPPGELQRAYITHESWQARADESERYFGVLMYYREGENKLYKGAEGEEGVCFEYDCWVGIRGADPATLFCNDATLLKVTCASVEALPPGVAL